MDDMKTLTVLLGDVPVGTLTLDAQERSEFRLFESYKELYPQPVLGQVFLDDLNKVHSTRAKVPQWFSNLLPEGPLRELIAKQVGVATEREFYLLRHLGEDLPGAVRITSGYMLNMPDEYEEGINDNLEGDDLWHFSLAGVQLKFSANKKDRGLTVPITGRGGDWIIKLPDARFPKVPENEWSTMRWAADSGIRIPEIELVDVDSIKGLPDSIYSFDENKALAIRRFDRTASGGRVHIEDFAQVLNLYPKDKYEKYNYETIANLINSLSGLDALDEFIKRLIFVIASGNGDAHHKNWSLIYTDTVNADLSPAYDFVSTIQYMPGDNLALNFGKSKKWENVSIETFKRMARKIGVDEKWVEERVASHSDSIISSWRRSDDHFGFDDLSGHKIDGHIHSIPLFQRI